MDTSIVILLGNLGGDPKQKYTAAGKPVTEVSLAVNTGKPDAPPTWYRVSCWGTLGQIIVDKGRRGMKALVIGELQLVPWMDKAKQPRLDPQVNAFKFILTTSEAATAVAAAVTAAIDPLAESDEETPF